MVRTCKWFVVVEDLSREGTGLTRGHRMSGIPDQNDPIDWRDILNQGIVPCLENTIVSDRIISFNFQSRSTYHHLLQAIHLRLFHRDSELGIQRLYPLLRLPQPLFRCARLDPVIIAHFSTFHHHPVIISIRSIVADTVETAEENKIRAIRDVARISQLKLTFHISTVKPTLAHSECRRGRDLQDLRVGFLQNMWADYVDNQPFHHPYPFHHHSHGKMVSTNQH